MIRAIRGSNPRPGDKRGGTAVVSTCASRTGREKRGPPRPVRPWLVRKDAARVFAYPGPRGGMLRARRSPRPVRPRPTVPLQPPEERPRRPAPTPHRGRRPSSGPRRRRSPSRGRRSPFRRRPLRRRSPGPAALSRPARPRVRDRLAVRRPWRPGTAPGAGAMPGAASWPAPGRPAVDAPRGRCRLRPALTRARGRPRRRVLPRGSAVVTRWARPGDSSGSAGAGTLGPRRGDTPTAPHRPAAGRRAATGAGELAAEAPADGGGKPGSRPLPVRSDGAVP